MMETEICYLLHIRGKSDKNDQEYVGRGIKDNALLCMLDQIGGSHSQYTYNPKVLIVLIESGYIWDKMKRDQPSSYPKLLISILENSNRKVIKEACCIQIIKYFGRPNSSSGEEDIEKQNEVKIQYINLI
jgi:hypothetical protein